MREFGIGLFALALAAQASAQKAAQRPELTPEQKADMARYKAKLSKGPKYRPWRDPESPYFGMSGKAVRKLQRQQRK